VFFTRADYILAFDALEKFTASRVNNHFIVGGYFDVGMDIHRCEQTSWREQGPQVLQAHGREYDHVMVDAGVWITTKTVFDSVGGLDESLTAWGHAQTVFQYKLFRSGVPFIRIPSVLFYHAEHGYEIPRDHGIATSQIQALGLNIREMWARYDGPDHPYR